MQKGQLRQITSNIACYQIHSPLAIFVYLRLLILLYIYLLYYICILLNSYYTQVFLAKALSNLRNLSLRQKCTEKQTCLNASTCCQGPRIRNETRTLGH